jgi:serine/threonine protein kinase
MDTVLGTTIGRYRILDRIGRGGMANVYVAEPAGGSARVAIKVLTPLIAENGQFIQRFRQEARVVARLKHPNIIPVVDYGELDGQAYLVMPFLPHGSLADRLQRGPVVPEEGGRVIEQIASALEFAHQNGVIHRDIKPSNILLDEEGKAWLSDFGLAYIHDASLSLTGSAMLGTPAYVSPEQARGEKATARSDQYSFGIVVFEMATGELPFEAETPMGVLIKHIQTPLPLPRSINSAIPLHIERVILKATAKSPTDRFSSVAEMNEAFQAALRHTLSPSVHPAPDLIPAPPSHPTIPLGEGTLPRIAGRRVKPWQLGVAATLLALLVCLPSAYAGSLLLPGAAALSSAQLTAQAATIEALSAELRAREGNSLSPEQLEVALAQTMSAMDLPPAGGEDAPPAIEAAAFGGLFAGLLNDSSTPTPQGTAFNGSQSTATSSGGGGELPSATSTRTPYGAPTSTRTATPVATSPGPSNTPVPATNTALPPTSTSAPPTNTSVPQPTNTSAPQPTNTSAPQPTEAPPTDVPPGLCGKKGLVCTPSP